MLSQPHKSVRAQELCESRGGRPGLPSLIISLRLLLCGKATLQQQQKSVMGSGIRVIIPQVKSSLLFIPHAVSLKGAREGGRGGG